MENPHVKHRERMKKQFLDYGLDSFETHNALELLLFFAVPQKDTNELAHMLLNTFGSISAVLDAPYEELLKLDGIGPHVACLIKLIPAMANLYFSDKTEKRQKYTTTTSLFQYFIPKFLGKEQETLLVACFDNANQMLGCEKVAEGTAHYLHIPIQKIVRFAFKYNSQSIVLAHNHPSGLALPSSSDQLNTIELKKALQALEITLVDHIIIGKNSDYISMKEYGMLDDFPIP